MWRKVQVEEPRDSMLGGQGWGREEEERVGGDVEGVEGVVLGLLVVGVVVVVDDDDDDGEDEEGRDVCCFIMAVHAADEVHERHLGCVWLSCDVLT